MNDLILIAKLRGWKAYRTNIGDGSGDHDFVHNPDTGIIINKRRILENEFEIVNENAMVQEIELTDLNDLVTPLFIRYLENESNKLQF